MDIVAANTFLSLVFGGIGSVALHQVYGNPLAIKLYLAFIAVNLLMSLVIFLFDSTSDKAVYLLVPFVPFYTICLSFCIVILSCSYSTIETMTGHQVLRSIVLYHAIPILCAHYPVLRLKWRDFQTIKRIDFEKGHLNTSRVLIVSQLDWLLLGLCSGGSVVIFFLYTYSSFHHSIGKFYLLGICSSALLAVFTLYWQNAVFQLYRIAAWQIASGRHLIKK